MLWHNLHKIKKYLKVLNIINILEKLFKIDKDITGVSLIVVEDTRQRIRTIMP